MKRMANDETGGEAATVITHDESDDTLNRRGAMALARRLEKYWHDRGYYTARFWPEPIEERFAKVGTHEIYRVVCNFVNGLPPVYPDRTPKD